jgi:hypothetical protein
LKPYLENIPYTSTKQNNTKTQHWEMQIETAMSCHLPTLLGCILFVKLSVGEIEGLEHLHITGTD